MKKSKSLYLIMAVGLVVSAVTFLYAKLATTAPKAMTVPQNDCITAAKRLPGNPPQQLKAMNGLLRIAGSQFIVFERDGKRVEASAAQPDYGKVSELRFAGNGDIYAIGQQRSYKVLLMPAAESVALHTKVLPALYRRPCGLFGQMSGACQEANAIFSDTVSAVFLSGYDSRGRFKSYVYGLTGNVLDLSKEPSPNYQRDCGSSFVRMVGKSGAVTLDKQRLINLHDGSYQ